jgi:predicted MFS family arabinose efflux permease
MELQENSPPPPDAPNDAAPPLARRTLWVLTIGCGVAVANLYYAQPLLPAIAAEFEVGDRATGLAATLAQVGYTLGLLLFVPLGDIVERRRLILIMLLAVAGAVLAVAVAPGFAWFAVASLMLGMTTISPQLIVPLAATLAAPAERGRVVGTVMSGLLVGLLASRTFSGVIGAWLGWRPVFAIAAVLMLALAATLRWTLPTSRPSGPVLPYARLLASLVGLWRDEPVLRQSCLFGAMTFGAFSAFWNTLAFYLAQPPYEYGSNAVGLFGLLGIAGAVAASAAGRAADRFDPLWAIAVGMVAMALSFGLFWYTGQDLLWLCVGVVLMDLGAQASHISNQARIFAIRPEARNRMNTGYMVVYFVGGSLGSGLAAGAWGQWGWPGVCAVALALLAVGLAAWTMTLLMWRAVHLREQAS